jgi:DNA-binding MarR family transcriptional regulator
MRSLLAEDAPRAIGAKLGLVEAVVRPDDRRVLELRLTPAGRELAGAIDAANRRRQPILRAAG